MGTGLDNRALVAETGSGEPEVSAEMRKGLQQTFRHEPGRYEIRLKGHHDDRWADQFGGLTIRREDNDET